MEIDYSEIPQTPSTAKKESWRAPRHVFFGKKDPETGDMEVEPVYVHQELPRLIYKPHATEQKLVAKLVYTQPELDKLLDEGWGKNPGEFGVITSPSFEQILEAKQKEEEAPEAARRGRPPKS